MKTKTLLAAIGLTLASMATTVVYAATVNFGTGGPTGNYFGMANDIDRFCGNFPSGSNLNIHNTGGSITNIDGMISKKYNMIWVQEDVLQFYAKNNARKVNEKRQRVVMGGQPETLHLIVPKGYKPAGSGGLFSAFSEIFEDDKPISLDTLQGQTLGGWGGSLVSANALSHFSGLGMNIVEIPEGQRAAPRVPVLIVGGQPYAAVQTLLDTGKYTMLPVQSSTLEQRAPFYSQIKANYVVNGKLISIPTFSVRALLLAKYSRKAERNEDMLYLDQCLTENLADLADDPDTNPNWETVYEMNDDDEDGEFEPDWKHITQ